MTDWIHLTISFLVSQDMSFTSKDMKVFDCRFPSFPKVIESGWSASSQGDPIIDVAGSIHSFSPKMIWQVLTMKRYSGWLLYISCFLLNNSLLLRRNGKIIANTFRSTKFREFFTLKLFVMLTYDLHNHTVILLLNALTQVFEDFKAVWFFYKKVNLSISRKIIYNHKDIPLSTQDLYLHWSH